MSDRQDRQAPPEDAALRAIVEGVEAATGERFFALLVRHLVSALGVQYAFVSELSHDRQRFRTLALWGRGNMLDNLEFPVAGTPCEAVLNGEMSHHPERLQELFPADRGLVDWGCTATAEFRSSIPAARWSATLPSSTTSPCRTGRGGSP